MKKYTIIVSRYNSVSITIEADSLKAAEDIALDAVEGGGFFYDYDDQVEIADSYEETCKDAEVTIKQSEYFAD